MHSFVIFCVFKYAEFDGIQLPQLKGYVFWLIFYKYCRILTRFIYTIVFVLTKKDPQQFVMEIYIKWDKQRQSYTNALQ